MLEPSLDKNTQYADLVNKIIPFTTSTNKMERKAACDIHYLFHFAINENKNLVLLELNPGIENAIKYFTQEINNLINQTESWNPHIPYVHYELLNDIVRLIKEKILFKTDVAEFNNCLLKM
jgi:hypothetical protein